MSEDSVITTRLSKRWVARLDRLGEKLSMDEDMQLITAGKVTRSLAIRMALGEGVKVLEDKYDCPDHIDPIEEWQDTPAEG